ncbi:MAG: hypothetical protein AB1346_08765 [Thermodesulfobacteriota bacterium]
MRAVRRILFVSLWLLCGVSPTAFAEEYTFDESEIEKKPYHIGGYAELRPVLFGLDRDASLYKLRFYNRDEGAVLEEYNAALQLEGSLEAGIARLFVRTNTDYLNSWQGSHLATTLYEGFLSVKPSSSLTIDLGKKTLKWGKGYAWNPAAFVDRPKDPDDPEQNLEGFIVASADYIKSFQGPLKTVSFTPVLVPAFDGVNEDFGKTGHMNFAAKLYLLLYDTDIDFMALGGGSRPKRYGADFSRNLRTNFEIHGEFAFLKDNGRRTLRSSGEVVETENDTASYLAGMRYLTEADTTYILEYYRNGTGFTGNEMTDYFAFIDNAYNAFVSSGNDLLLQRAANVTPGNYGRPNPMKNYLYLRVSRKEPFDILYFTPSVTWIFNTNDRSFSLSPEIQYTGVKNLDLRLRASVLARDRFSEFGEKQNDWRAEIRARYYF